MLSKRLWQALNTPYTRHPLFWRTVKRGGGSQFYNPNHQWQSLLQRAFYIYLAVVAVMTIILNLVTRQFQHSLLGALALILAFPVALAIGFVLRYTVFKATINGIVWVHNISTLIAAQHEGHHTSVLAATPPGLLGASWAISSGYLYRNRSLLRYIYEREVIMRFMALATALYILTQRYQYQWEASLSLVYLGVCVGLYGIYYAVRTDILRYQVPPLAYKIGIVVCVLILLLIGYTTSQSYESIGESLYILIHALAFMAAFYIDSFHTPVIAALVGVLSARYARRKADAKMWGLGFFLTVQAAAYLFTLLCAFFVLPLLYSRMGIYLTYTAAISIPVVSVGVLFFVREAFIALLWHLMKRNLNIGHEEMGIFANQVV